MSIFSETQCSTMGYFKHENTSLLTWYSSIQGFRYAHL